MGQSTKPPFFLPVNRICQPWYKTRLFCFWTAHLSFTLQAHTARHSFMSSKLFLYLLLHVFYLATVKAFPVPPMALASFQQLSPNLGDRVDTHFVTLYGLYDNSLHTPTVDTSKLKLAPITEAFMAMTGTLATPTVTRSGSQSVMHVATPTPLHQTTPNTLGQGSVVRPTPVQSSIASSSTDMPEDILQRATKTRTHRLIIFGSIIAGVVFLGLLLVFLLDPRVMRILCGNKVDDNLPLPSKKFYRRPKSTWNVSPISSSDYVFMDNPTEKTFFATKNPDDVKLPISKFSICSSEYPPSSAASPTSEYEHDCLTPKTPARPPRPPTADSPTLSDSVYFACADQPYIIVPPHPSTVLDNQPSMLTGPLSPREFFNMYLAYPQDSDVTATLPRAQPNTIREFYNARHSRTYSAPLFIGSINDQNNDRPGPTAVQRMLKHRSRSTSGWPYPNRHQRLYN